MWFCFWATGQGCNTIPLCLASKVGPTVLSSLFLEGTTFSVHAGKQNSFVLLYFYTFVLMACPIAAERRYIVLNTVTAWLVNYRTHYFPCIFWIIAMLSFFFLFKNNGNFLCFFVWKKVLNRHFLLFSPCPSRQPPFVLAIIEIPLI